MVAVCCGTLLVKLLLSAKTTEATFCSGYEQAVAQQPVADMAPQELTEITVADPAKEARDFQLSEMGFDPNAGHSISVNYTSSLSQTK